MSRWACSRCTYENVSGTACEVCLTPRADFESEGQGSGPKEISCTACTFMNSPSARYCEVCGTGLSTTSGAADEQGHREGAEQTAHQTQCAEASHDPVFTNNSHPSEHPFKSKRPIETERDSTEDVHSIDKKQKTDAERETGGMNGFLQKLHLDRLARGRVVGTDEAARSAIMSFASTSNAATGLNVQPVSRTISGSNPAAATIRSVTVLTYNVWFNESVEVEKRMGAIGAIIEKHKPHVICLQEVTLNIYKMFESSSWWSQYKCSKTRRDASCVTYFTMQCCRLPNAQFQAPHPFSNSVMGRELETVKTSINNGSIPLLVANSHLESPCPGPPTWDQMFSKERVAQARQAFQLLDKERNVVFCGDMNWDEKTDGAPPLPSPEWKDAWTQVHPRKVGFTFDTKTNAMIAENRTLQKRVDRFFCRLTDFDISGIEMVGTETLPGVTYVKEKKSSKKLSKDLQRITLPVLPSDHYGLLLTLQCKDL